MLKIRERMGQEGLTLIELLITIAVLAIVAAIAIPVVTNVVGSTNDRAATQTQSDITDFVEKYNKAGAYTYSDGVFSGYVDLNGDGSASDDEKIEELVVDTGKFTITPDGDTPPSDTAGDFYGTTPNTTFAVEGASGGGEVAEPLEFIAPFGGPAGGTIGMPGQYGNDDDPFVALTNVNADDMTPALYEAITSRDSWTVTIVNKKPSLQPYNLTTTPQTFEVNEEVNGGQLEAIVGWNNFVFAEDANVAPESGWNSLDYWMDPIDALIIDINESAGTMTITLA